MRFRRPRLAALTLPGVPKAVSYIEEGCSLAGELRFQESVRIDGRIEGEIRANGHVIVGETAFVEASIFADSVIVLGQVEGEITVRRQVTVYKSGRVEGDIRTSGIAVEPGATLKGCIMIGDEPPPALAAGNAPPPRPKPTPGAKPMTDTKPDLPKKNGGSGKS